MTSYGVATEAKISEVVKALELYGDRSIVALAGVPGTGKTYVAAIAAQRYADEPLLVREIQFHQSYSYEEFIEGMRIGGEGTVSVEPGVFLEWNQRALDDPERKYVLLIEELTRANIASVLGELMTYVEHRSRPFLTVYSRRPLCVAPNLAILATYNPTDRSAIEIDSALLRRLRIVSFPPSTKQLAEMLAAREVPQPVIGKLQQLFDACSNQDNYEYVMPFGHGMFCDIQQEQPDLYNLWHQRIRHLLHRPHIDRHPYTQIIEEHYPWRASPKETLPAAEESRSDEQ